MKNQDQIEAVQRAVETLSVFQELPDDPDMVVALEDAGFPTDEAQRLVALLPLAFGRVFLRRFGIMALRNDARVAHPDGSTTEIRLTDQPLFKAALHVAAGAEGTPIATALARHSVEVIVLAPHIRPGEPLNVRGLSAPYLVGFAKGVFKKPPWWLRRIG